MIELEKYSVGVGDRFAHQARAQLRAFELASEQGACATPVWNKSNREHALIGSEPESVFAAARQGVRESGWKKGWHVDADHIRLDTVDRFLKHSDFFTIDVADAINQPCSGEEVEAFVATHPELARPLEMPDGTGPLRIPESEIRRCAAKYLRAAQEAGRIYRHIAERKGAGNFIPEVSMDETDTPQTPPELLIILAALADEKIPAQTIAPKFTGRFNKGVDYEGDLAQFEREFTGDLSVIAFAVKEYGLPSNLKLSVHSGSDKFSLYPVIHRALAKTGAGLHLKTAGTTWLEEIIGLAEAGGGGLVFAQEIYAQALDHLDELCAPYASVISIQRTDLPSAEVARGWTSEEFTGALRHQPTNASFNPSLRQLLHVAFKLVAKQRARFYDLLDENRDVIGRNVTENLFERHLRPLFLGP